MFVKIYRIGFGKDFYIYGEKNQNSNFFYDACACLVSALNTCSLLLQLFGIAAMDRLSPLRPVLCACFSSTSRPHVFSYHIHHVFGLPILLPDGSVLSILLNILLPALGASLRCPCPDHRSLASFALYFAVLRYTHS